MNSDRGTVGQIANLTPLFADSLAGVDPSLHGAIIESIRDTLGRPATRAINRSLNEANTYYVVHNADLELLKSVVGLAIGFFPAFKPITALPTLVGLLYRYRRHRAAIDGEQAAVLLSLRAARPRGCTLSELMRALPLKTSLTEERLLEILNSLKAVQLENGKRSDFVAESSGVWTASDV